MIEEVLDKSFIQHQAENGAIEFNKYSDFVIDLMSKLAAPLRDQMISDITKLTDTVRCRFHIALFNLHRNVSPLSIVGGYISSYIGNVGGDEVGLGQQSDFNGAPVHSGSDCAIRAS